MTGQQFSQYLSDPGSVDERGVLQLGNLAVEYPYCQSLQLLLAAQFFLRDSVKYPGQLRRAAACAGDRTILKDLISRQDHQVQFIEPLAGIAPVIESFPGTEEIPDIEIPSMGLPAQPVSPAYERMTQEELLAIVKKRLAEINAAASSDPEQSMNQDVPALSVQANKATLIDKFIRDEPRISKPRASFFSPAESAIQSNFDEEEIVSETLAHLYAKQGNVKKAIQIYTKLSLINQEKSRYFAAQIEKLGSL